MITILLLGVFSILMFELVWTLIITVLGVTDLWNMTHYSMALQNSIFYAGFLVGLLAVISIAYLMTSRAGSGLLRVLSGARNPVKREMDRIQPLIKSLQSTIERKMGHAPQKLHLLMYDDTSVNAFALGRNTLILHTGLLSTFDDATVSAVIAHELGHLHHKDTQRLAMAVGLSFFVSLLIKLSIVSSILLVMVRRIHGMIAWILLPLALLLVALVYFGKLGGFVFDIALRAGGRKHEFRADKFACDAGFSKGLLGFLEHLTKSENIGKDMLSRISSTHPPTMVRIDRIDHFMAKAAE